MVLVSDVSAGAEFDPELSDSPGKKKLLGEMLWEALIPLQPAPANNKASNKPNRIGTRIKLILAV
jgi:hypothetical protein